MSSVVEEHGVPSEHPSEQGLSSKSSMEDVDAIHSAPHHGTQSPYLSEKSAIASTTGFAHSNEPRYFHSRRVKKGEVEKPWLTKKDPMEKWVKVLPITGILLGVLLSIFIVWEGLQSVTNHKYCIIYDEDFANGLDTTIWEKEVEVGGYGYSSIYPALACMSLHSAGMDNLSGRQAPTRTSLSKMAHYISSPLCRMNLT